MADIYPSGDLNLANTMLLRGTQGSTAVAPRSDVGATIARRIANARKITLTTEELRGLYIDLLARLPADSSRWRRIIDWALVSGGAFRGHWVSGAIVRITRYRLGLANLRSIQAIGEGSAGADQIPAAARRFFAGLGIFVVVASK